MLKLDLLICKKLDFELKLQLKLHIFISNQVKLSHAKLAFNLISDRIAKNATFAILSLIETKFDLEFIINRKFYPCS